MKLLDWLHESKVHVRRVRVLSHILKDLIPPKAAVLDVGCGDGLIAKSLLELRPDIGVAGIDVNVRPRTHIPVQKFNGFKIPYKENSFDVVLFVDVLHHVDNPLALLNEAKRTTRHLILIKDHMREGVLAIPRLRFMDWVGNYRFGIPLPYNFLSREQWYEVFKQLALSVVYCNQCIHLYPQPFDWIFGGYLQVVYQLKKL
jgi:SAM-dependent methyltransferase